MTLMVGPLGGCYRWVRQHSPMSFEGDVDGGPPGGRCRRVQQHPPPSLKTTSMVGPLGGAVGGSDSVHH
jgi:hypothetical protein